ncbi:hypothetical protein AAFP30_22245 [Gordonia sp. CPCC 205515]|uniref:hypothetical protein n=1 Tax=Gordonia sp. CPCC 205515 TaxID=3140791 RepID=UPI003AF3A525
MPDNRRQHPIDPRYDPRSAAVSTPGVVTVYGTPRPVTAGTIVFRFLAAIGVVGILIGIATGNPGILVISVVAAIMLGVPALVIWYAGRLQAGKPQIAASLMGLWTPAIELTWNEIQACEFTEAYLEYTTFTGPQMVKSSKVERRSLVVTTNAVDANGRPLQYGSTLWLSHTNNLDQFWSAVHQFAPHVGQWSVLTASQYVPIPAIQDAIAREIATTGMVSIRDGEGNPKFAFNPDGVVFDDGSLLRWGDVVAMTASTDREASNAAVTTCFTNRLIILSQQAQERNRAISREQPVLPKGYTPPIEQVMATVLRWAPHVRYTDSRKIEGALA